MKKLQTFVDNCYIPDVLAVAGAFPEYFEVGRGCGNFLAYGVFPESADSSQKLFPSGVLTNGSLSPFDPSRITEDTRHSFFSSGSGLRPDRGETVPQSHKSGAYSWLKAPRYGGTVMEVGPLARVLIAYHSGRNPEVNRLVDSLLGQLNRPADHLLSALGRHAARALECKIVADRCLEWADQLRPGEPTCADFEIPATGHGVGLTEAPRGALGHWIELEDHKIANYQCVVPTTWNCSPRDDRGQLGPVEQALLETPIADAKNPIEATRVVRSFDPCLACAVH